MEPKNHNLHAFRNVPKTGVIYVMSEAGKRGFYYGNDAWANLGQGAPETGMIEGCPERLDVVDVPPSSLEYGTVAGIMDLREAVAELYNKRYRRGMRSQYTAENVAISPGGRSGLTRLAASLNHLNLGHFIPDYTAYEELLDLYRRLIPIPIPLKPERGFRPDPQTMRERTVSMGLGGLLLSNPCNPTGQALYGQDLDDVVCMSRELGVALILDEFYSHYAYDDIVQEGGLSAAAFVEDVDKDPVVILDGLTKNWRYPGLRLSWTVAPKQVIDCLGSAGSFLDGGAPHPIQCAAIDLLSPELADREARSIRRHFGRKRKMVLSRLQELGFVLPAQPQGSFYAFVSLENMPEPLRDGMVLFEKGLDYKVICVPGVFFDVNPGKRRSHIPSRLTAYVRISYGPAEDELVRGLDALERLVAAYR